MMVQGPAAAASPYPSWPPVSTDAHLCAAPPAPSFSSNDLGVAMHEPAAPAAPVLGKRKAEAQDNNERLSKRLSLLNLERGGNKLYVPVETPSNAHVPSTAAAADAAVSEPSSSGPFDDCMQVDDSRHKVYIYNLDDELASSESDDDDGRLVFLPDVQKHLRDNRIPPHVLANNEGELAGMQLVLYSDPKSLSVPEDKDGVRRAILEARERTRERQRLEREGAYTSSTQSAALNDDDEAMDVD